MEEREPLDSDQTPEGRDEISPHDLPKDHPGRQEAERQAGDDPDGTARGNT